MKRYSANYLIKTRQIAKTTTPTLQVTLQFFQRANNVVLCGMNEVLALLQKETDIKAYEVHYLPEKSLIQGGDVVLELRGQYHLFGHLEGIIDGILARQSSIATNAHNTLQAAGTKNVVFMGDRADHYRNQVGDGYAAACGGVTTQVTAAQVATHDGLAVGTMPHALIAMHGGDIVAALKAYATTYPKAPLTALIDFNNDVITDALKALTAFGQRLQAVRVDTSPAMIDQMFQNQKDAPHGVAIEQIKRLRQALNAAGGTEVKIIVSSGFDAARIKEFELANAPVDTYGVGASILKVWVNFTADIVQVASRNIAKSGRGYRPMGKHLVLAS